MTDESGQGAGRRPAGKTQFGTTGRGAEGGGASYGEFAGVGLQFAVAILMFLYAGQWLDRKLGTAPLMLYVGVFTGAAAGFYSMYRKLMAIQEREERAKRERQEPQRAGREGGGA